MLWIVLLSGVHCFFQKTESLMLYFFIFHLPQNPCEAELWICLEIVFQVHKPD